MKKYYLKNGIISLFYPIETSYSVAISLNINVKVSLEPRSCRGITHFLEHLHFRRLNNITQDEIYLITDKIGGNLNGSTYRDMMRFYIKVRPDYIYQALEVLKEIILADTWTENDVKTEKSIVLNEIAEKEDCFDMETLTDSVIFENILSESPILGTAETVRNLKTAEIIDYKRKTFSEGNVALTVTGQISDEDIEKINAFLENIELFHSQCKQQQGLKRIENKRRIKFFEYDFYCVYVTMSFRIKDKTNLYALNLLNSLLGGGSGGLLQREIREKKGISYDIYSYVDICEEFSAINIAFSVIEENACCCIKEVIRILGELKHEVTKDEYERNIVYFTDNLWYMLEDTTRLNDEISWEVFENEIPKTVEERIEGYRKVSLSELRDLAKEIFLPEYCSVIAVGSFKEETKKHIENILKK